MKPKLLIIVALSGLLLAGPCYGERRRSTAHQPTTQPQPEAQPAAPPPTLAELPASPPQVSFRDGQLTISAQNSTLGDILKAVRAQTGATIDLPGTAPERVVGHFGPAPARDVLTLLLNGSHFNFLLLGSATDPGALERVILMAKSGPESSPEPPTQQANAYNQAIYNRPNAMPMAAPMSPAPGGNTVVVDGQDAQDDSADDSADATDDTQADDGSDQADQTTDDQAAATDDQQQQQDGQPAVKTPEQLLQELQQRQLQLQQQGIQPGVPPGMRPFPNPGGQPGDGTNPPPPHN